MNGVYKKLPALPKDTVTNTNILSLSPVKDLSLKDLTFKAVTMTALLSAQRSQTIHLFSLDNIYRYSSLALQSFAFMSKLSTLLG